MTIKYIYVVFYDDWEHGIAIATCTTLRNAREIIQLALIKDKNNEYYIRRFEVNSTNLPKKYKR